ncbi:MAG: hypothetical protein IKQ72_12095 [Bacteroidaceae bacterium]|nr:hypothetical protein [Bacteroidaceae bacterium]
MTTDNYNHRDSNLRKALAHREQLLPEMPADLNDRLIQRVADTRRRNRRIVWPWVAAACIAGVISIVLMPPKESTTGVASSVECVASNTDVNTEEDKHTDTLKVTTEDMPVMTKRKVTYHTQQVAVVSKPQPKDDTVEANPAATSEQAPLEYVTDDGKRIILATNPERLKYTPEEIEKLKERVRQKYIELLQLETEIFEATQEQLSAMNEEIKN